MNKKNHSPAGYWANDEAGLPCFELRAPADWHPYTPLKHLLATGRLSAFLDRWGNLALFTTEGDQGLQHIAENKHQSRSGLYWMVWSGDEPTALLYGELLGSKKARYGVGYGQYDGAAYIAGQCFAVNQRFICPPNEGRSLLGFIRLEHQGETSVTFRLQACSDFSSVDIHGKDSQVLEPAATEGQAVLEGIHPVLGNLFLTGPEDFDGKGISWVGIGLEKEITLQPGDSFTACFSVGYGDASDANQAAQQVRTTSFEKELQRWQDKLAPAAIPHLPEPWMQSETLWTAGQFLAFKNYSTYRDAFYISLGGYGWGGCNQRELSENALGLSRPFPEEAESSMRWTAQSQFSCGDLPKTFVPKPDPDAKAPRSRCSSDTEVWFLLALMEHAQSDRGLAFLEQKVPYCDAAEATIWEHAVASYQWIVNPEGVGIGKHGLIKSRMGDWNDYLFPMGSGGEGESMMNTGIAARGFDLLAILAKKRGDDALAAEVAQTCQELRQAAGKVFDETHFPRGFTDAGRAVGATADDRCFINVQSWAVLGACGTKEQRLSALRHALTVCYDERGLCLVSRPFPSPPPPDVSSLPIPAGEGENGGVWPQAVAWFIWALAEEGLYEDALATWQRMSFRHAAEVYPDTPFGLFNGPDCYNSHLAGSLKHWTQVQLWDRRVFTPMNPAVAWHHFALAQIMEHQQ